MFSSNKDQTMGPSVLKRDIGVRALGMGGAAVGLVKDASAIYWNPAEMQDVPQPEVHSMHAGIFVDQTQDHLAVLWPHWWRGARGTLGVSVDRLAHEEFEVQEGGEPAGSDAPSEMVAGVSYARPLGPGAWGLTGKWVRQSLFEQSGHTYAMDLGFGGKARGWRYGLVMANLGPDLTLGETHTPLPILFRTGVGRSQIPLARGAVAVGLQTELPSDEDARASLGLEWGRAFATIWAGSLRAGYRTNGSRLSLGAGLIRGGMSFNYAYEMTGNLGATNSFDVLFRFGNPVAQEVQRNDLVRRTREELAASHFAEAATHLESLEAFAPRTPELPLLRARLNEGMADSVDPALLWRMGQEAEQTQAWDQAAYHYRKLLIVDPKHEAGARALKAVERKMSEAQSAAAREAVERARRREGLAAADRARRLAIGGAWSGALRAWNEALGKGDPVPASWVEEWGKAAAQVYTEAEEAERGERWTSSAELYQLLAVGDRPYRNSAQRLKQVLEKAAADRRQKAQTAYERGLKAYQEGQREEARRFFELALEQDPTHRAALRALERVRTESPVERRP